MDITKLHKNCLIEKLTEAQLIKNVTHLSQIFNFRLDQIKNYAKNPALVAAYASFYMPLNIDKLKFILSNIEEFPQDPKFWESCEIVDFGCGPGTYSLALYEYLKKPKELSFKFIDSSKIMLDQAKKITENLYPSLKASFHQDLFRNINKNKKPVLLFGNIVNECGHLYALDIVTKLKPEIIILIEPGTKQAFNQILPFRDEMIKNKYNCLYPCPAMSSCPIAHDENQWCHQILKTKQDPALQRMGQLVKLDRKVQPFIGHVYSRFKASPKNAFLFRQKKITKHSFEWQLCQNQGDQLALVNAQIPKKNLKKQDIIKIKELSCGFFPKFEVLKKINDSTTLISLKHD
jgi:SAM-dependent methyltransferase